MSHRKSETDAYYKFCNDISKIIGTNDKPKPKPKLQPPKLDAFGNPLNQNSKSYVSSAGCNNFSAGSYSGSCGSYSSSAVPNA
jgi:hypothetical protein